MFIYNLITHQNEKVGIYMTINLLIILLMILLTAFFVAAEFGFVKIRKSKLESMSQEGNKKATLALYIANHLDEYLSACQLGITLTSLAIGWIGESTLEQLLHPVMELFPFTSAVRTLISFILAFVIMTFVHVVIGELIPKSYSITKTETVVLWVARPLHLFYKVMYPFIWLLNKSAAGIGKLLGIELASEEGETHSEEELLIIASESLTHGEINSAEYEYMTNIFRFDDLNAREIMLSRTEIDVLEVGMSVKEALDISIKEGHSRYPVIKGTKDDIIGYITQSELIEMLLNNPEDKIGENVSKCLFAMETTPVKELLERMKQNKKHLVILVDEYGGTSGLITIEDIMEEIVGDIQDEKDDERPLMVKISDNQYLLDGQIELYELEKSLGVTFEKETINSVSLGGMITEKFGTDIEKGYTFSLGDFKFEVLDIEREVLVTRVKMTCFITENEKK